MIPSAGLSFTAVDDIFFESPFSDPEIFFQDGAFQGFNFISNPIEVGGLFYEVALFSGSDPTEPDLEIYSYDLAESIVTGSFTGQKVSED